jgi:transcription elongation GreA/GreB family factor
MNKQAIIQLISEKIASELEALKAAAIAAADAATGDESKQEDKHDTRATEASYLARGQAERVSALERELLAYRGFPLKSFGPADPIAVGALVKLKSGAHARWLLLTPQAGGLSVKVDGIEVQALSVTSPLGDALIAARVGDEVDIESPKESKTYEVLEIK